MIARVCDTQMVLGLTLFAGLRHNMGLRSLRKADERDRQAFPPEPEDPSRTAERMLDEYGSSILRLAYSYLHNMSDAEDIVQETLIRYLRKPPCFAGKAHEKAWLLKVAVNLSKNKIKYNKVRQADVLEETLAAEERPDLSFVWEAVKELKTPYREVIHLFYYAGYQATEIAMILNRKESTIRSDLRRGREQLRAILKEEYDFE